MPSPRARTMLIHADFSRRAAVGADAPHWVSSPQPGVQRLMLDRIGAEQARATSLVRYAPDSVFPAHGHPGGEEILVLEGTFSDDSGDYPAGWYLRHPPGSAHRPSSADGALIFVKLRQMPDTETRTLRIDTRDPAAWQHDGEHAVCALHEGGGERVMLLRLPPGAVTTPDARGGAELLVIEGRLMEGAEAHDRHGWLRLPPGAVVSFTAGAAGATLYLKTGHLATAGR